MASRQKQTVSESRVRLFGYDFTGWKFRALSALVLLICTGIGAAMSSEFERWRSSGAEQARAASESSKAYDALGDIPRRAGEYIAAKREGSTEDVRAVARLLRTMMFDIENKRYSVSHFQTAIAGRAAYWRDAFTILAANKSPASRDFSKGELLMFRALANDLAALLTLYGKSFKSESVDVAAAAQDGRVLSEYR